MDVMDRQSLKAVSSETRQDILKLLAKRPYTASELAKATGKHVTTMAEHVATLEKSGLVYKKESSNKWKYYALTAKGESIVKPERMWAIALSSLVGIIAGGFLLSGIYPRYAPSVPITEKAGEAAGAATDYSIDIAGMLGIALVALGIAGILYAAWKKLGK
ncbi:MAG: winged helix-turn-helix transcriptional regulator [Candidatus Aenigmarchaeota archaeon]|nr:winged helix-turn-helix transcriptional regulator [Candidatus Aenigmarchaeota archaeon]